MPNLISFDIDGTLEVGEPRGSVSMEFVRIVQQHGNLIGSCSDRPISHQRHMWRHCGIQPDFTALKHRLAEVKTRFDADTYTHIGDTDVDERFALEAGFDFIRVDTHAHRTWAECVLNHSAPRQRFMHVQPPPVP